MQDLLNLAPQLGIAAFILGAVIFFRREQLKNGGITRAEFAAFAARVDTKLDLIRSDQANIKEDVARQDEKCKAFHDRDDAK